MTKEFKKGDRDPYIAKIQRALNEQLRDITLKPDGDFGAMTENALKNWQLASAVPATGMFSGATMEKLAKYIDERFLKYSDFEDAAQLLGVDVAAVQAVQEVESKGEGFLPKGTPIILFERHVFRKELIKRMERLPLLARSINDYLVSIGYQIPPGAQFQSWVTSRLDLHFASIFSTAPGGYVGGVGEWTRLNQARKIDEVAANMSCSWGLFQIMGYHYGVLGYQSVEDMVKDCQASEKNQLMQFCRFVLADRNLSRALKAKDFTMFARYYNGPNYSVNRYDQKMKLAYMKYLGVK